MYNTFNYNSHAQRQQKLKLPSYHISPVSPPPPSRVSHQGESSRAGLTDDDNQSGESEESRTDDASGDEESEAEDTEAHEAEGGGEDEGAAEEAAAATQEAERRRPVAPLFSFPPGPRVQRTEAEESLQVGSLVWISVVCCRASIRTTVRNRGLRHATMSKAAKI